MDVVAPKTPDTADQEHLRHELRQRVNELTCLVTVSRAVDESVDVSAVCVISAAALVLAMRRPDLAVASVELAGRAHTTGELATVEAQLSVPVLVNGRERGRIRLAYTDAGMDFLLQERNLLQSVVTTLGLWLEHRESSAALDESEARFRRLVTNIPDVVFRYRVGADEGLDYVSPSVQALTGFSPEELLADPTLVHGIVGPKVASPTTDGIAATRTGRRPNSPAVKLIARDGSPHWIEHDFVNVYDTDGTLVAVEGVARDVTQAVAASDAVEQRVREHAVLARVGQAALLAYTFDDLFDLATKLMLTTLSLDATAVYELSPNRLDLRLTSGSGWPAGVVGGTRLRLEDGSLASAALTRDAPVVVPDIAADPRVVAPFLEAQGLVSALTVVVGGTDTAWGALGGYTRTRREYSDDEVQFVQTLAHILGAAVNRANAEAALARSERESRTLAENLPDIVARFDRDLRHLYVNPRVESALGLSPSQLIGKTIRELGMPAPLMEIWEDAAERVFVSGEPATVELVVYPAQGRGVHLQSLIIPEFDSDGTVRTVMAVSRDITSLRQAEAQRREGLARIVAAQEEERARIGGDIHDDSIQVMTAVGMRLDSLRRQVTDADAVVQLGRLEEAVRHSINRLRTLMFELRPPELDRDGLAEALRLYLESTSDGGVPLGELVDNCAQALPAAQRTVLYRIALEAITNARKHADAFRLQIMLDNVDGGVRLQVRDDGCGFDTAELAHMAPHHLGTTTMRERADVAGGSLHIRSAKGEGTVVTAWLPSPADHQVEA